MIRRALLPAAGLLLVACSQGGETAAPGEAAAPTPNSPAVVAPATAPPAGQAAANPLGSGSGLTGAVSGLEGRITAFQVEETPTAFIVELAADVLFAFDSADLGPGAPEQLGKTVAVIGRGGSGDIQVIGHTDSVGEDAYNQALSLRRARAVVAWLASEGGAPAARLKAEGRGETEPVAPNAGSEGNDYPEGRAMNRRVTVVIPKA